MLLAEVERLRAENERQLDWVEHLEKAARKIWNGPSLHPQHLGRCIGVLSEPTCDCGLTDLRLAVMAMDEAAAATPSQSASSPPSPG